MKKALVLSVILLLVPSCGWFTTNQEKVAETQPDKTSVTHEKLKKLDAAIASYKDKVGSLPTNLKDLVDGPKDEALRKNWTEALVVEADLMDGWNQPFMYTVATAEGVPPYELYSVEERAAATKEAQG